jgi:ribosomal protein S27E
MSHGKFEVSVYCHRCGSTVSVVEWGSASHVSSLGDDVFELFARGYVKCPKCEELIFEGRGPTLERAYP